MTHGQIRNGEGEEQQTAAVPFIHNWREGWVGANVIALSFLGDNATLTLSPVEG